MNINTFQPSEAAVAAAQPQLDALKKATNGIEGMFVKDLLNEMQKSLNKGMFGKSAGSGIYQDMMNQELATQVGKDGSLGISKMLYSQLSPKILAQAEARVRLGLQK